MNRRLAILAALLALLLTGMQAQGSAAEGILLLGTDSIGYREITGQEELSRADAIFILYAPDDGGNLRILSIERDYLVDLPKGHGLNKLSTATYFGGPDMALQAVNTLFDLNLKHYLQIDIPGTVQAIDAMGGVDVMVYEEELAVVNASPIIEPKIGAGINHFNGKKAQAFMRVRDLNEQIVDSNSARNNRQIRVLTAIMEKSRTLGFRQAGRLALEVLPLMNTNMSLYDLLMFARPALAADLAGDSMEYRKSPMSAYRTRRANLHLVVIAEDMAEEIRLVHQFLNE